MVVLPDCIIFVALFIAMTTNTNRENIWLEAIEKYKEHTGNAPKPKAFALLPSFFIAGFDERFILYPSLFYFLHNEEELDLCWLKVRLVGCWRLNKYVMMMIKMMI